MDAKPTKLSEVIRAGTVEGYLTQSAAAAYVGRSPRLLQLEHRAGTAPPSIKVGRERRYLKADLEAWLAERGRK